MILWALFIPNPSILIRVTFIALINPFSHSLQFMELEQLLTSLFLLEE